MKFSVIRQSLSGTLVLFCLLAGLFAVRHGVAEAVPAMGAAAPLGRLMAGVTGTGWGDMAAALFFALWAAVSITRLVSRNLVFAAKTHTFLPLMAIVSLGIVWQSPMSPAVAAMFLLARGSEYMAAAFRRTSRPGDLFGGGMMPGLAPLVYAPASIFLFMVPLAMMVFRRSKRESALTVVGVLLPVFIAAYWTWARGGAFLSVFTDTADFLMTRQGFEPLPPMAALVCGGLAAACVVVSLGSLAADSGTIRTRALRIHVYMVCFLVVAGLGFALPCASWGDLPMAAVPVGVVGASWFSRHDGWIPNVLYILIILSAIVAHVGFY